MILTVLASCIAIYYIELYTTLEVKDWTEKSEKGMSLLSRNRINQVV